MNKFALAIIIVFLFSAVNAQIIKVPQDFPTIQSAINASGNGDTILVSTGTYYENIRFNGKNVVLTSNFIFSGNLEDIVNTIIDGSQPPHPDTASCVLFINHETRNAVIQGFTITGGKGTVWVDEHGAGNYREGGGILSAFASPTIRFNRIVYNEAYDKTGIQSAGGGAIRSGDANPLIENNIIAFNKARYGGGIVLNYTSALIRNNIIYGNTGGEDYAGSGVWANSNGLTPNLLYNNTIVQNSSTKPGGGVFAWGTYMTLKNNIIYDNTAPSNANLRNSGSSLIVAYNDIGGGYSGTGNIDVNPLFQDKFMLSPISLCIDAGDTSELFNDIENPLSPGFALYPSLGGLRNDIGAYGGPYAKLLPDLVTSVSEFINELPTSFKLEQNYPNPFNPSTIISYTLPESNFVTLKVFDILGKEVTTLINNEWKEAGVYNFKLEIDNYKLSSGVYFYQLRVGGYSTGFGNGYVETKKMTLLR